MGEPFVVGIGGSCSFDGYMGRAADDAIDVGGAHTLGDFRCGDGVADAHAAETVSFRESTADDDGKSLADQRNHG